MHNFKKLIRALCVAAAAAALFLALDYALYPCTFTRNDIHAVLTKQYDDLYLGTSHGKMDIDPETMEAVSGRSGHNLCVGGEYSQDSYYLVKLVLEKGYKPSRIVYEVSPGYFTSEKEEGNNYLLFYHEFPLSTAKLDYFWNTVKDCNFRTALFPWYEYPLAYELEHLGATIRKKWAGDYGAEDLRSDTQEYHESGFVERYPVDPSQLAMAELAQFSEESVVPRNMDYLEKLIALCRENEIEFVALVTPMPGDTLAAYAESFTAAYEYFGDFFAQHDVRYLNFNSNQYYEAFSHDITAYTDYDGHLNGDAAREFSKLLAQVLDGTYEPPVQQETERVIAG